MPTDHQISYVAFQEGYSPLLGEAARLHVEHLSGNGFITLFGAEFIQEIYKDAVSNGIGVFVFALKENKLIGFVMGCTSTRTLFSIVKRRLIHYAKFIIPCLIRKPRIMLNLLETFFYVKKENSVIEPELIVIVTDADHRGAGVGSALVASLNEAFRKRGIASYKVTVHDGKTISNAFYVKNGMSLKAHFMMYGMKWNLYENGISK